MKFKTSEKSSSVEPEPTIQHLLIQREVYGNSQPIIRFFTQLREQKLAETVNKLKNGSISLDDFSAEMQAAVKYGDFTNVLVLIDLLSETEELNKSLQIKSILKDLLLTVTPNHFRRCSLTCDDIEKIYESLIGTDGSIVIPEISLLNTLLDYMTCNPRLIHDAILLKWRMLENLGNMSDSELSKGIRFIEKKFHEAHMDPRNHLIDYLIELVNVSCGAAVSARNKLIWGMQHPGAQALQRQKIEVANTRLQNIRMKCDAVFQLVVLNDPEALYHKAIAIICTHFRDDEERMKLISDHKITYLVEYFERENLESGFSCLLLAEQQSYPPACDYAKQLRNAKIVLQETSSPMQVL